MTLKKRSIDEAVTGVFQHTQSPETDPDDAEQAIVTDSWGAGDFGFSLGVVGAVGPTYDAIHER